MSSSEDIQEVFLSDIAQKTKQVRSKEGMLPFLDGITGMTVKEMYWGVMNDEDRDLVCRIADTLDTDPTDEQIVAALKEMAAGGIDIVGNAGGGSDG